MFSSAAFESIIYLIIDLLSSASPVIFIGGSGGEILIKGKEIKTGNKKISQQHFPPSQKKGQDDFSFSSRWCIL
jgi:hypothetical protein